MLEGKKVALPAVMHAVHGNATSVVLRSCFMMPTMVGQCRPAVGWTPCVLERWARLSLLHVICVRCAIFTMSSGSRCFCWLSCAESSFIVGRGVSRRILPPWSPKTPPALPPSSRASRASVFVKGIFDGAGVNSSRLPGAPWYFCACVFDVACSESIFCARRSEITVACCCWSCIMCRAFATRSSETCSAVDAEDSSPSTAPTEWLPVTGQAERILL